MFLATNGRQSTGKVIIIPGAARILPVSFPYCHKIPNFAKKVMIKPSTDSLGLLLKQDLFKNFPDYKNFPCSNATMLQGFLGLWVTCVGHACYAGHAVYENYKGLIGHTL